jgi:uncharacterized membrane protein YfcA
VILALVAASFGAGVMNAMAGGGTIVTFPTLIFLGLPAIEANATSTVALLPGAASSLAGYWKDVSTHRHWLTSLLLPSLAGGALGSVLLLMTPEKVFARLAPLLVLFATLLFAWQTVRAARVSDSEVHKRTMPFWAASAYQFGVAVYGGYFGAGIGILMLVVLGAMGLKDIHAMNGLKNFFGMSINIVAAGYFIVRGVVHWPEALVMIGGATVGGYAGARFARKIGKEKARGAVIVIGVLVAVLLYFQGRR